MHKPIPSYDRSFKRNEWDAGKWSCMSGLPPLPGWSHSQNLEGLGEPLPASNETIILPEEAFVLEVTEKMYHNKKSLSNIKSEEIKEEGG